MKKKNNFKICFLILLISFGVGIGKADAYDLKMVEDEYLFQGDEDVVRGFFWDLPSSVILENEKGTLVQAEGEDDNQNAVFFIDKIMGVRSSIGYEFKEDQLSRVRIFSENFFRTPQERIDDLLTMQLYLTERYGPPIREDFTWRNARDKNFPDSWGAAVYRGDLRIDIIWQNKESFTRLSLGNREIYKPELSIIFEKPYDKESTKTFTLENGFKLPQ